MVRVHHDEGMANHIGPEPCVHVREGLGEASAGGRAGQPSSRERVIGPGADVVTKTEGNTAEASSRAFCRPGVVKDPGMSASSSFGNREISRPATEGFQMPAVDAGSTGFTAGV